METGIDESKAFLFLMNLFQYGAIKNNGNYYIINPIDEVFDNEKILNASRNFEFFNGIEKEDDDRLDSIKKNR